MGQRAFLRGFGIKEIISAQASVLVLCVVNKKVKSNEIKFTNLIYTGYFERVIRYRLSSRKNSDFQTENDLCALW